MLPEIDIVRRPVEIPLVRRRLEKDSCPVVKQRLCLQTPNSRPLKHFVTQFGESGRLPRKETQQRKPGRRGDLRMDERFATPVEYLFAIKAERIIANLNRLLPCLIRRNGNGVRIAQRGLPEPLVDGLSDEMAILEIFF